MTELSFEYRWALSRRRTFLWSLFFSSSLVLPVYFSHRFIQAVSASFQNRFSTWLDLCSTSAPTHKTLPLSPEAQLTWHDNALAAHSFRQEKQMREICPSFSTTPGLKPPGVFGCFGRHFTWHYLLQALFQNLVSYCLNGTQLRLTI